MASAKRFSVYPASFVHAGGTLNLSQLSSFSVSPGGQKKAFTPGGSVNPAAHLLSHATPEVSLQTTDLTTLLAVLSLTTGLNCTSGATFRLQERSSGATFEAGATHETFTSTAGFLNVESISASIDDENGASLDLKYTPLWGGSTRPLVHNTGVDFNTAPTPAFNSQFFLGPVYLNGAQLEGITRVAFRPGISFMVKRTDGDPYARLGAVVKVEPVFEFTTLKADVGGVLNVFGRALGGVFAIYLQAGVNNSDRVAAASSAHIKISVATGDAQHDTVQASGEDDATATFSVRGTGSVTLATGSAIP